jgi:hypothetical protein
VGIIPRMIMNRHLVRAASDALGQLPSISLEFTFL